MTVSHLLLFASIFTFILGLPVNVLAFHTFYVKLRKEPTPADMLLLNLSIADLIFLAFLPLKMKEAADNIDWNLPYILCPISTIFFFSCIYTITLLLTALAVERYLGMAFPFRYKVWRRPRYAMIASILFWLVSIINVSLTYSAPSMHLDNVTSTMAPEVQKPMSCYDHQYEQTPFVKAVRLELFLVLFLIPFLICCFCYINFVRITLHQPTIPRKQRQRAVGLAMVTLLVFSICFAPYNISYVMDYVHGRIPQGWRALALISSTLTASLVPMMFFFSFTMRQAVRHCLQCLMEKLCIWRCSQAQHCPPVVPAQTDSVLFDSVRH